MQSIRNRELFHGIEISYKQCWNYMLWLDLANHAGIKVLFLSLEVSHSIPLKEIHM